MYALQIILAFFRSLKYRLFGDSCFSNSFPETTSTVTIREKTLFIEAYRRELLHSKTLISKGTMGAGSKKSGTSDTVSNLVKTMSVSCHHGRILSTIVARFRPDFILELGTAFGISTLYLAAGYINCRLITIEGNEQLATLAQDTFLKEGYENITVIHDQFDHALQKIDLQNANRILIFIDGNHTYEATLFYYDQLKKFGKQMVMIFDDINWSISMMKAWREIRLCERFTEDSFRMGFVIRNNSNFTAKCTE